jgi:UDP-N-acetylglucosamine 1-carboxyvinyltransferase
MIPLHQPTVAAEVIAIRPGPPLRGTVSVDGSKNAALPLIAAAAVLRRPVRLSNVPDSTDVQTMLTLLREAGHQVVGLAGQRGTILISPGDTPRVAQGLYATASRIRASYYLVPALLAVHGRASLPWPGGCRIGARGMEQHFRVYEAFGDRFATDQQGYAVEMDTARTGSVSMALPFRSRGATVAAVLRAVASGRALHLRQPNLSSEVLSVLDSLRTVGWASSADAQTLALAPPVHTPGEPVAWKVPGDKIEAVTLACAVAASAGNARIEGVRSRDVASVVTAMRRAGIPVAVEENAINIRAQDTRFTHQPLRAVASLSPGGLDADFEPSLMALGLGLPGTHYFSDSINPGRHSNLVPQLMCMGAEIEEVSATQCHLTGPQRLTGAGVETTDIRTGSALLIAGLTARGITTLGGLEQLRRGHADLPAKLRSLGADICEVAP